MGIWARIIDNHITEILEDGMSPHGLVHPEQIEKNDVPGHWEEVPDGCHVGWWFKNGQWISGEQYYIEWDLEHPKPEPGPPHAHIIKNVLHRPEEHKTYVHVEANIGGHGFNEDDEHHEWIVEGQVYTDEKLDLVYEHKDEPYTVDIQLTAFGPGGEHTHHVDDEEVITIPAKFVPLFYQMLAGNTSGVQPTFAPGTNAVGLPELDANHNWKPAMTGTVTEHVDNPGDHPDAITPAGNASDKVPSGVVVTGNGTSVSGPDAVITHEVETATPPVYTPAPTKPA
jgi:hypothetical protein